MTGQDLKDLRRRWGDTPILNETGWRMRTLRVYSSRRGELSRRTSLQLRLAHARLCAAERQETADRARQQRSWYQRVWDALLNKTSLTT